MKNKKNFLCIILARGGSKSIPRKNIYPINNHPLISYTISAALNSRFIKNVIVSTDDKKIAKISKEYGALVPFLRPKNLAKDKTLSVDALRHSVIECEKIFETKFDYVIELPCVSPFRDETDIDGALELLLKSKKDSVISYVNTGEKHPIRLKRITGNKVKDFCREYPEPKKGSRRQDFEPSYIRNGAIYAMRRDCIIKQKSRQGKNSLPFIMNENKSINIDNKFDLLTAKLLIEKGYCTNVPKKIDKKVLFYKKNFKKKILITTPLHFLKEIKNQLTKKYDCIITKTQDQNKIKSLVKYVDCWFCSPCPTYLINEDILKFAQNLKLIVTPSTGSNHIDKDFCKKKNIKVKTLLKTKFIKKIYASSEFTFGLLLSTIKKIPKSVEISKSGHWRDEEDILRGHELHGKTIGIIGFGRIGSNVAKYAVAFGMKVLAYDPFKKIKNKNISQKRSYSDVISKADILFICVNLNDKTKNMINHVWFKKIKKGSILINTSRGEIVSETGLIKALKSKVLSYVATDVVKDEQKDIKKNKLIKFSKINDRLLITPHIAGLTYESEEKAAQQSLITINNFFKDKNK